MAENIATLGIKVDSKDIKKLNDEFIKTLSLSGQVETSTKKITSSFKSTGEESKKLSKIEEGRITAVQRMISALADQEKKIALTKEGYNQYKLSLMGATEAEKKIAQEIISNTSAIQAAKKKENEIIKSNLASYKANIADQISLERQVVKEQTNRVNSIQKILSSLSYQEKKLTSTRDEIIKYNLALLGASEAEKKAATEMLGRIKNIKEAEIAKKQSIIQEQKAAKESSKIASDKIKEQTLIENAENKRIKSIDRLIQSLTMQEIKLRGGKAALTDYKLSLLGASDAERKQAKEILSKITAIEDANKSTKKHNEIIKASTLIYASSIAAITALVYKTGELVKESALFSARYQTLGVVLQTVGKTAGYSSLELEKTSKSLQEQGISMQTSRESTIKLIQAHIDLSNAQKLGRIAQDAAVIGNVNSSHALERLVYGIQTAQIEVLKSIGLNVNFENSYKKLAAQIGKNVSDLTESEKTQARLNVVLERGADIAGTYEAAMTTAGKQITSFSRYIEDFKVKFGEAFNDATARIVKETTEYIQDLTKSIGSNETQTGMKQLADGIAVILSLFLKTAKAAAEVTKYIGFIGNVGDNLKLEQKGIELVNQGLIDQAKYTKASWEEKKKLISQAEPISKVTKKITEQTEGYNLFADSIKKAAEQERKRLKEISDNEDKELNIKKEISKEKEKQLKQAETEEKKRVKFIDDYIAKLEQEAETYNKGKEFTADYILGLKDATDAQKQRALAAAKTIDAMKAEAYWEKKREKQLSDYESLVDKVTPKMLKNEIDRQEAIELTSKVFNEKLIPAAGNAVAIFNLLQEKQDAISNINKYFNTDELNKFEASLKDVKDEIGSFSASSFGNELADGINNAVISMRSLVSYLDKQSKIEEELNKKREEAQKLTGAEERKKALKEVNDLEEKNITNQLSGYRQLFGTTSQLFKENTKERKALHTLEMAFAAAEIAMNLQKTISAAYTAIATQGSGDPYTAFARIAAMTALMGGIVAAAGGSLSGGGSASAPSSSMATQSSTALGSTDQSQSVSTAFSFLEDIESGQYNELKDISKSMKDLNKNITGLVTSIVRTGGVGDLGVTEGVSTTTGSNFLKYGAGTPFLSPILFNDLLQEVKRGMSQVSKDVLTALSPLTFGASSIISDLLSNATSAIFGGSRKTSVLASGLQVTPGSIGSLTAGGSAMTQAFADIKTKKEGGLFGSDKTYFKTLTGEVDQSVQDMMTKVFQNMGQTMVAIAEGLGGQDMEKVYNYVFSVDNINLKDLDTEGIDKALTEAISTTSNLAAETLFKELIGKYQQIGEGLLDTAVRIVAEKAIVLDIIDVTSKGFLGANIPEIAIETSQALINFAGSLDNLTDSFATYYDKFFTDQEKQTRLQTQLTESMSSMNMVLPNTREGFRQLVEVQNLHTEAGQQNYVTLLQLAEGADKYYTVLENTASETQKAIEKEWELANARKETVKKASEALQVEYLTAQGRSAEALALSRKIELESIDESLRPMKLRIWALQDATKAEEAATAAIEAEKKAIEEAAAARKSELENLIKNTVQAQIDGYQAIADAANEALTVAEGLLKRSFEAEKNRITSAHEDILKGLTANLDEAQSAADSLRSTFDGLASARKSMTLAGTEQATYSQAQTQLMSALGMARQGDFTGASAVSADTSALTQDTRGFYSSFEDYQREFFKTKNAITELENLTGDALSEQETMVAILQTQIDLETEHFNLQMVALDNQLDSILGVDKSVINLTDAITQYQDAQYAADGANTLLKTQTDYLNNMMMTLFDTNVKTGNLVNLVDEYVHPEKYNDKATSVTTISNKSEETQKEMNDDLIRQIKILTDTMERGNYTIAKSTQDTAKTLKKWDYDGLPEVVA